MRPAIESRSWRSGEIKRPSAVKVGSDVGQRLPDWVRTGSELEGVELAAPSERAEAELVCAEFLGGN
jgi:hypothetical protein